MRNSKKWKALVSALAMALFINGGLAAVMPNTALAGSSSGHEATVPRAVLADTLKPYEVNPGDTVEVTIPVKASNYMIRKPIIEVDLSKTGGFTLASDVKHYNKDSEASKTITVYETSYIKFSVYIPLNAKKGTYNDIPIKFITTDSFNDYTEVILHQASKLTFKVKDEKKLASFSLVDSDVPEEVRENDKLELSFYFKNNGELAAKKASVSLEGYESLFRLDGSQPTLQLGDVNAKGIASANFKLIGAKNLPTNLAQLSLMLRFEHEDGSQGDPQRFVFSLQTIAKEEKKEEKKNETPLVKMKGVSYPKNKVNVGETFELVYTIQNTSKFAAKDLSFDVEGYFEAGFKPAKAYDKERIALLKAGEERTIRRTFVATNSITTGLKAITAKYSYFAANDKEAAKPFNEVFTNYIDAVGKAEEITNRPMIQVTDVNYPRDTVNFGETFKIIYTLKNTGKIDARNFVAEVTGYSEAGFKPSKAYDKKRVSLLKIGETVKIELELTAIETIASGIKPLALNFSYFSKDDTKLLNQITDSMNTYIDVKGKPEDKLQSDLNNSIPRLMIADYNTGDEKIMAGKIFNFSFNVLNSHSSVSADNIKATVSSGDGTFSIVEGSASFYISSLSAGETKNLTIPLKVKGDIATNGYDVNVKFEYEYLKKDTTNGNNVLTKQTTELTEALKLQVFSNDRPKLSNVRVGDGESPKFMEPTNLTFDFNNMGKSPLYNVTAEVKGDFKPLNDVLIIGNVNAGEGKSWSMEVTPMVENMGSGILTISYEDSNGNINSYDTEFNGEILAADSGVPDMPEIPNLPIQEEKKDIMPLWVFVLGNVVIFFAGILITKNMIIKNYKKKKRAEIEKEDEEL